MYVDSINYRYLTKKLFLFLRQILRHFFHHSSASRFFIFSTSFPRYFLIFLIIILFPAILTKLYTFYCWWSPVSVNCTKSPHLPFSFDSNITYFYPDVERKCSLQPYLLPYIFIIVILILHRKLKGVFTMSDQFNISSISGFSISQIEPSDLPTVLDCMNEIYRELPEKSWFSMDEREDLIRYTPGFSLRE